MQIRVLHYQGEKVTKSFFSSYKNGLLVAVSPGNLVFWVNVFGVVLAKPYAQGEPTNFLIVAAGVLSGILLHDMGLMDIISVIRKAMNRTTIKRLTIVAGVLLLGFAGYFNYELVLAIQVYI